MHKMSKIVIQLKSEFHKMLKRTALAKDINLKALIIQEK